MFRTNSPYSPFFTSGLLSEPFTVTSDHVPRRGSLPSSRSPAAKGSSALYSSMQPRWDEQQLRSFLFLDLAESQSMRSASIRRQASSSSRLPFRFLPISEVPAPPASTPLRIRFSRDSLRSIPSPKPAPSITLPDLPTKPHHSSPPRLPSIPLIPALDLTLPPRQSSSLPRAAVPHLPKSAWSQDSSNLIRLSVFTTSTVSTRARRNNRSYALARLEGRHTQPLASSSSPRENFMSMSDDEDDADGDADEENSDDDSEDDSDHQDPYDDASDLESFDLNLLNFNPIMEPEDCVLPLPLASSSFLEAPRSAPLPPTKPYSRLNVYTRGPLRSAPSGAKKQRTTITRKPSSRKRSNPSSQKVGPSATSEWFPLKSFIDLRTERERDTLSSAGPRTRARNTSTKAGSTSGSWGTWRSFVEVANVS